MKDYKWDFPAAEQEFKRAIELNPKYPTAHQWYGELLSYLGRPAEAMTEQNRARELDPLSLIISADIAQLHVFARQYDQAIEQGWKTLELDPNFGVADIFIGWAYLQKPDYPAAVAAFKKAYQLTNSKEALAATGYAYAKMGRKGEALDVIGQLRKVAGKEYVPPYSYAVVYAGLGDKDQTMDWLEKVYEERSFYAILLNADPLFDTLRSDPRFQALLRKIGFK